MSGGELEFIDIFTLAVYFLAIWYAGRLSNLVGLSSIPAEIGVGILFGPEGLDLVSEFSHDYIPLSFMGYIGVSLVIFESGMHLDVSRVLNWETGGNAVIVAIFGTCLPIFLGIAFFTALGFDAYPDGLAAGFSLAPTSVGISLSLLTKAKQLQSHYGQVIISAAFLDDIFSIICLVVLINLAAGAFNPVTHVVYPLLQAFALVIGCAACSVLAMPQVMAFVLETRSCLRYISDEHRSMNVKDETHLSIMFVSFVMFSWIGDLIGSSLLGAFAAGMLFSNVPRSAIIWSRQFKRGVAFLMKIFFAATVAFSIPLSTLFTAEAVWKGLIIGAIPCLLSKLCSGVFVGAERWVIGVAMMARGEFAYLVADQAFSEEQLTKVGYSVVVWALLWATMIAPVAFGHVLQSYVTEEFRITGDGKGRATRIGGGNFSGESSFIIRLTGSHHMGMVREIIDSLHSQDLDVLQSSTESDGIIATGTFVVAPRQAMIFKKNLKAGKSMLDMSEAKQRKYRMVTDLDDEKLDQIAETLKETINDQHAVVLFEATEKESEVNQLTVVEIKLFGEHDSGILKEITNFLMIDCELDVRKSIVEKTAEDIDYSVFYCSRRVEGDEEAQQNAEVDNAKAAIDALNDDGGGGIQLTREKSNSKIVNVARQLSSSIIKAPREKSNSDIIKATREQSAIRVSREGSSTGVIEAPRQRSAASIALQMPQTLERTIAVVPKGKSNPSTPVSHKSAAGAAAHGGAGGDASTSSQPSTPGGGEHKKAGYASALAAGDSSRKLVGGSGGSVIKEITSTFTAEQRDLIREGIRQIYADHGLSGGSALVKMIHEEEVGATMTAADFLKGKKRSMMIGNKMVTTGSAEPMAEEDLLDGITVVHSGKGGYMDDSIKA
eukprot:CAMPEP_0174985228 /NCGR_PEP_ID=MMETSP0004_2-20121128/18219_1 /TAXON_ID=420556 /ORGANISM="Ochromonas sp., Strain CCMP1393" /LENGTH=888 /DNA_ID=CAMNT_0016237841 /DNA_START=139 /DNA_END=2805 /DNA_ORIENTATION=-